MEGFITKPAHSSKESGMTKLEGSPQLEHGNDTTMTRRGKEGVRFTF